MIGVDEEIKLPNFDELVLNKPDKYKVHTTDIQGFELQGTPKVLYHCTSELCAEKVLKLGLSLEQAKSENKGVLAIFMSYAPEYCFGNTCLVINVEGLHVEKTINNWEYVCYENIPPDRISYHSFKEIE